MEIKQNSVSQRIVSETLQKVGDGNDEEKEGGEVAV